MSEMPYGLPAVALDRLLAFFRRDGRIHKIWLFGSRALGRESLGSDIDIGLDAPTLGIKELAMLEAQIDDLLLPWKVDLVLLHHITDPDLLAHIRRVGIDLLDHTALVSEKSRK